ncbi:MAG: hypothetical protein ABIF82_06585 [Planctomycetota bacterium]
MKKALIALTLVLAAASPALAAAQPKKLPPLSKRLAKKVTCKLAAAPFLDAFAALRADCNFDGVVDPALREKNPKLTITLTDMSCSNVLQFLAKEMGAMCSQADGIVSVGYPEFIGRVRQVGAPHTLDGNLHESLKRRTTFTMIDTPLRDAAALLRKDLEVNIWVAPGGGEKDERLTLELKNVRGDAALKYVALLVGRTAYAEKGIIVFSAPPKLEEEPKPEPKPESEPKPNPNSKPEPKPLEDGF